MMDIPFHQYQRYRMTQLIIDILREDKKMRILEVGANEHKNLEKFLPNDDIYYLDIQLSEERLKDKQYIQGDATNLKFDKNEFDYIIALDVLEHIPKERREMFFENIKRVSKYGFIVSFPFDNNETAYTEERIEHLYKYMYNQKITWHEEHKEMGLPKLEDIDNILRERMNLKTEVIYHGDNYLFEKLSNIEALNNSDVEIGDYWGSINRYYNNKVFYEDRTEEKSKAIRAFVIYDKNYEKLNKCIKTIKSKISLWKESDKRVLYLLEDFRTNILIRHVCGNNDKEKIQYFEQINLLKNEYGKTVNRIAQLEEQNSIQIGSYKHLQDEYNRLIENYKHLESEYNRLLEGNNHLEVEYNKQIGSYKHLQDEYNRLIENYKHLESEYNRLVEGNNHLKVEYNKRVTINKQLEKDCKNKQEIIIELQEQINRLNLENIKLKQDNNILNTNIKELLAFKESIVNSKVWKMKNKLRRK